MLIGATMNTADLGGYAPLLVGNNIMRIFPSTATVAGRSARVLPDWTDNRFTYCRQVGAIPFVSTKVDGDADAIAHVRDQLLAMPAWIPTLYITDRHEPEGDVSAEAFRANFNAFLAMIDGLPPELRRRIRCGPVLTRTWTEKDGPAGGLKPGRSYDMYDPGTGDFFAVDMYVQSGTSKAVVSPDTLPDAHAFTAAFKAYRKNADDHRDRLWPEEGVIGMPGDPDGTIRAAWIRSVYDEVSSWDPAELGWKFVAMIWWNATGKATGQVAGIGQRRDFPLHLRTAPPTAGGFSAGGSATAVRLPGDPPAPVAAYNAIFLAENKPTDPTTTDTSPPDSDNTPPVSDGTYADGYADGWRAGRARLAEEVTAIASEAVAP